MNNNFKIDFIGIGAQKCATTWIAQCLEEHPQICLSDLKEVNFFNKQDSFYHKSRDWNYQKGISWYESHFSHCSQNKIKGEFSVAYLYDKDTASLIKKSFPEVKIIVSLRNPVQRTYSQYQHVLRKAPELKEELGSFKQAIEKEPEFIERSLYYKQLKRYFDVFPQKNILVLIYEEIEEDPVKFIQNIYKFLNVDPNFTPPSSAKRILTGRDYYLRPINKMVNIGYRVLFGHPELLELMRKLKIDILVKRIQKMNRKEYSKMTFQTRENLQNIFKKDVENLEKLLNKDLHFWQE